MTGKDLFQEIGNISDEYIVEAEGYRRKATGHIAFRSRRENGVIQRQEENSPFILRKMGKIIRLSGQSGLHRTLATAACLVVCLGLVFTGQKVGVNEKKAFDAESTFMRQLDGLAPEAAAPNAAEEAAAPGEAGETMDFSEACLTVESMKEERKEELSGIQEEVAMTNNKEAAGQKSEVYLTNDKDDTGQKQEMAVTDGKDVGGLAQGTHAPENSIVQETEKYVAETPEKYPFKEELMDGSIQAVKAHQANYSNSYEELLQEEEAVVVARGSIQSGKDLWERFRLSAIAGEQAQIDVITFTIEGDAIIKTIYFQDGMFRLCVDRTRDRELGTGEAYYESTFTWLEAIETKKEEKTMIEYVLRRKSAESTGLTSEDENYLIFYIEK